MNLKNKKLSEHLNSKLVIKQIALLLIAFCAIYATAYGQSNLVNSLNREFPKSNNSKKITILIELANIAVINDPMKAEQLADSAVTIAVRSNSKLQLALAYNCLSQAQITAGKYDLGITNLLNSSVIYQTIKDEKGQIEVLNKLGNAYLGLKKLDQAYISYYKAHELAKKDVRFEPLAAITGSGIASVLMEQNQYSRALLYLTFSKAFFDKINNKRFGFYITEMMGDCQYRMGNFATAKENIESVIPYFTEIIDEYALGLCYYHLGQIEFKLNNTTQSIVYFNTSLKLAQKRRAWDNIQENALMLSKAYEKNSNTAGAYSSYKLFTQYKDSIINKERIKSQVNAETKFETVKKEQQLKLKDAALATSALKINSRNYLLYFFVAIFTLLFLLLYFLVKQNREKKLANLLLESKNLVITREKQRSDELLLNILPAEIAEELKQNGKAESKMHNEVSILFTDFKGFTALSEKLTAKELIDELNYCFIGFDNIIGKYSIEKIKTIGDAYMAAAGLPLADQHHADKLVNAAIEIRDFMENYKQERILQNKLYFTLRIGIHSGHVVAGIVGVKKFAYDVWGDTVNTASRMESSGEVGKINISETTYQLIKNDFECAPRGAIEAKGKGQMMMYFVEKLAVKG